MGLLRDTYITFKNDPSGQYAIADQMKQKNEIEKEQMILLKNTRDRIVYNKLERQPQYMNFVLYIGFEIDPKITED